MHFCNFWSSIFIKPISFQYRQNKIVSLNWNFVQMNRNLKRFEYASRDVEVGKISGAVGNFANVPPRLQDLICKDLKLSSAKISTQVLQRDRHSHYLSVLSLIATAAALGYGMGGSYVCRGKDRPARCVPTYSGRDIFPRFYVF